MTTAPFPDEAVDPVEQQLDLTLDAPPLPPGTPFVPRPH